ncbi:MAG: glycosyl transferase, partial [Gammaproteobacteria bacterium]|nr:glycosyl transferase [Gammaproteobacteria bacterium]
DTQLPPNARDILGQLQYDAVQWGFFPVLLDGKSWQFRVIEKFISTRSRLTRIATGDQALFLRKALFQSCGGFAAIPLMEDVELCKLLRRQAPPLVLAKTPVVTASRRWQQHGIVATVLLMWRLRWLYWLGVNPRQLALQYRQG